MTRYMYNVYSTWHYKQFENYLIIIIALYVRVYNVLLN